MFQIKKVWSEEEAQRAASPEKVKDGDYSATFDSITEGTAQKSGRDMMTVALVIDGPNGSVTINDYWVDTPKAALKIRHACAAAGVLAQLEAGEPLTPEMFLGKRCIVRIVTEKAHKGFAARNSVADYLESASVVSLRAAG